MSHAGDANPATVLERPTNVRWHLIFILMGLTGLNHFHRQSLPAVVDQIMNDNGLVAKQMGWVYSSFLLGYVLFMVPGGWLADRRGGKPSLTLYGFGTAAMVAATGYCGLGMSAVLGFALLLVIRWLMGVLSTPLFPAAGKIINAWVPFESRGWANGLVLGATTIGVSAAPIVFGKMSDLVGWRNACLVSGAVTALLSLVWWAYGRNRPAEHPSVNAAELVRIRGPIKPIEHKQPAGDLLGLLRNPNLVLITLIYGTVGYYEYTLFYWIKYYFSDVLHYTETASRTYTSIVSSAMIFAMPLGGILSDRLVKTRGYRFGRISIPIIGMIGSAGFLYAATLAKTEFTVVGLFFLAHAAIGLCEAPTWVASLEIGRENCATSAAIANTGGNLGGLFAPVVTVYVAEEFGWNAGFLVASGACVLGVILWLGIRLNHPDDPAA